MKHGRHWSMRVRALCTHLAFVGLAYGPGMAEAEPVGAADRRAANKQIVMAWYERDLALAKSNTALFVCPGLIADRTARVVRVYGEGLGLNPGDPVEFVLIPEQSGKDYEALALSFARPSDVHRALEFIGMKPGQAANPADLRFWPRGERVRMAFEALSTNGAATPIGRAEATILDTRTNQSLPEVGFVFCGGRWLTPEADAPGTTGPVYAADVYSPNSIVSVYNEGGTVLDVPRRAPQGEVYTFQVPNPAHRLPTGRMLRATLAPLFADGPQRLVDWSVAVHAASNGACCMSARDSQGKAIVEREPLDRLAVAARKLIADGRDLFATITPDDAVPLAALATAYSNIAQMEDTLGLRIEPPPAGHPYYKAFLPNPAHRDRTQRPMQPFELQLAEATSGSATGVLTLVSEEWKDGAAAPTYRERTWPVGGPGDLLAPFDTKDSPAVLLVFAPESLAYGQIRPYAAVAAKRKMILFVFAGKPVGAVPTAAAASLAP